MKLNRTRPFVFAASLAAAAVVIGADTTPKKDAKPAEAPAAAKAEPKAGEAPAAVKAEPKADEVVATVNGENIQRSAVEAEIEKMLRQRGMPPGSMPADQKDQIIRQMLDQMVLDKLVTKASVGIKVSDAEVDGEYAKILQRFGGSDEEVKKQLAQSGMTLEALKIDIRDRMQKRKWMDEQLKGKYQDPSEAEAKEFYEKNPQHFEKPETVRASHILFQLKPDATPDAVAATVKKATTAIERAKKEDFAKLAGELSEEPGAKERGGDLNYFPRTGAMVEPFAEAAFKLKKDEVTAQPVRTDFGYHVIKVTDRREAGKQPFPEAKEQIVSFLGREKKGAAMNGVIADLRSKAQVDIKLPPAAPAAPPVSVATPPIAAPEAKPDAKPAPVRKPIEAVTPPVSVPAAEPKKDAPKSAPKKEAPKKK